MVLMPGNQSELLPKSSFAEDFCPKIAKIEMILTCLATFWRIPTSYLLENGSKQPSQALSTITTISCANANNNNNKGAQH